MSDYRHISFNVNVNAKSLIKYPEVTHRSLWTVFKMHTNKIPEDEKIQRSLVEWEVKINSQTNQEDLKLVQIFRRLRHL